MKFIIYFIVLLSANLCFAAQSQPSYAIWSSDAQLALSERNADAIRPAASITKLMTVLVTLERNLDLNERVVVVGREHSSHIKRGMSITRHDLINIALIASDNLAANTLSETSGITKNEFITLMNFKAYTLGMVNTKYADAVGLSPFNISTVGDIKLLTEYIERYGVFSEAASKISVQVTAVNKNKTAKVIVRNTNSFAGRLELMSAKTGYTIAAGRCLTMSFYKNNKKYILVILGASSKEQRQKMATKLIDSIE